MPNRGLFGLSVNHVVRSESVWNSLGLCSSSSSSGSSSSKCISSSSSSGSSSSSFRHLESACSGLQCLTTAARQGRADPIGSQANPPGRRGLIGYYLTALGHNLEAKQAVGTGSAAGPGNLPIPKHCA